jgi:hypothetical protein
MSSRRSVEGSAFSMSFDAHGAISPNSLSMTQSRPVSIGAVIDAHDRQIVIVTFILLFYSGSRRLLSPSATPLVRQWFHGSTTPAAETYPKQTPCQYGAGILIRTCLTSVAADAGTMSHGLKPIEECGPKKISCRTGSHKALA